MIRLKKLGCICGVVCLVGILLAGCTEEEVKILPNIVLSIMTLDFGSVIVNEASAMQTVTLSNPMIRRDSGACHLNKCRVSGWRILCCEW